MSKKILFFFRLVLLCGLLEACATGMSMDSARIAYDQGDYVTALNYYREDEPLQRDQGCR